MILLIDNYDSFTFNLYQMLAGHGVEVDVQRNDALAVDDILSDPPLAIVLSPGPGLPEDSGLCPELVARLPARIPLLGVCLGHQVLVQSYGGLLELDPSPTHGRASHVHHDGRGLYEGVPSPFTAGRYHSIRATRAGLPPALELSAWTDGGLVMGVRHRSAPQFGVQFHPESIMTRVGSRLLENFVAHARSEHSAGG